MSDWSAVTSHVGRMEEEEEEESGRFFFPKGSKAKLRFLGFCLGAIGRQRRLESRACPCGRMHQHVHTVAQCRNGWQRRLEATQAGLEFVGPPEVPGWGRNGGTAGSE